MGWSDTDKPIGEPFSIVRVKLDLIISPEHREVFLRELSRGVQDFGLRLNKAEWQVMMEKMGEYEAQRLARIDNEGKDGGMPFFGAKLVVMQETGHRVMEGDQEGIDELRKRWDIGELPGL